MKFFKLTKLRRFLILGVTIASAILAIALGGSLFVAKDAKKGLEYGGGAEYIVQVDANSGQDAQDIAPGVALSIQDRIDPTGVQGVKVSPENTGVDSATGKRGAQVRVTVPGLTDKAAIDAMQDLIVHKPTLTLTDIYGNPLFDANGHFNARLSSSTASYVGVGTESGVEDFRTEHSMVPIDQDGAKGTQTNTGEHEVSLKLIPGTEYTTAWTKATSYISQLGGSDAKSAGAHEILAWLNYEDFITMAKTEFPSEWAKSGHNPYLFAHVNEALADATTKKANMLKEAIFTQRGYSKGADYMISAASVKQALSGTSFVISGSFTQDEVDDLAKNINFGVAKYSLSHAVSNNLSASYGATAFNKAMIAGLVVFAFVAIFLIANYGLLGALSTISIALYIFLILALFTVMRGEYSPETIAALIIGIGMGVDANIITFERLKHEVYSGASVKKAFSKSNKQSLTTILDANITTLIVAFVLFYFGSNSIVGLSVTLILSIVFTLIVMLGFTRFAATMLVNTGVFESRKHLLGLRPKFDGKVQEKINKFDYIKNSKWFVIASASIFAIALIVMGVTAGISGSISGGFALSQEFTGGTAIHIVTLGTKDAANITDVHKALIDLGIPSGDIIQTATTSNGAVAQAFDVHTSFIANLSKMSSVLTSGNVSNNISNTTSDVATKLVRDAMISIGVAIGLIILYTMIRFKWTFSIAAIVALIHDGLMVTALFVICRVEISPVFIAGLLSILGYSINDTIVTFDRIREKMNNSMGELTPAKIKTIANDAIKDTLKRSILTSLTTVIAVLILMAFGNATKLSFNLAMLVGLVAGTYSSIFIASYLWVKLETRRQKRIKIRAKNGFWKTDEVEEQTFDGINDFVA